MSDPSVPESLIGRTIGNYVIDALIGSGGMGSVYRAHHVTLERAVAIKVSNRVGVDPALVERFTREAHASARISHPNVVHIIDFGVHDGRHHLVTELVVGEPLQAMLARHLVIAPGELVSILLQTLDGLGAIAAQGLVHRDIKPDNLLITRDGRVKIIDFGLALPTGGDGGGHLAGTPTYMSPEHWDGGAIDHRADQFSLGVTAYIALTGTKPFVGATPAEQRDAVRSQRPQPPHQVNASVPPALSAVVMRMIHRDPGARFPDHSTCARTLLQAWESSQGGADPRLTPPTQLLWRTPRTPLGATVASPPSDRPTSRVVRTVRADPPASGSGTRASPAAGSARSGPREGGPSPGQDAIAAAERLIDQGRWQEALDLLDHARSGERDPSRTRHLLALRETALRSGERARVDRAVAQVNDAMAAGGAANWRLALARIAEVERGLRSGDERERLARTLGPLAAVARRRLRQRRILWSAVAALALAAAIALIRLVG